MKENFLKNIYPFRFGEMCEDRTLKETSFKFKTHLQFIIKAGA